MKKLLVLVVLAAGASSLFAGCGPAEKPASTAPDNKSDAKEKKIAAALAELSPEDQKLAEAQKFCAFANTTRLGGMGKPYKIEIEGRPVFLCCAGCKDGALKDPEATLAKVEKLKAANK